MEASLKNSEQFFCMINNFVLRTLYVDLHIIVPYVK